MAKPIRYCRCCHRTSIPTEPLCKDCYNLTRDITTILQPLYRAYPALRSMTLAELVKKMTQHYLSRAPP